MTFPTRRLSAFQGSASATGMLGDATSTSTPPASSTPPPGTTATGTAPGPDLSPTQLFVAGVAVTAGVALIAIGLTAGVGAAAGALVAKVAAPKGEEPQYGKGAAIGAGAALVGALVLPRVAG